MTYTDPLNPSKGVIAVNNRKGRFISNSHSDLIKHAIKESMNITTGILDSDDLWKIISDPNEQKYNLKYYLNLVEILDKILKLSLENLELSNLLL